MCVCVYVHENEVPFCYSTCAAHSAGLAEVFSHWWHISLKFAGCRKDRFSTVSGCLMIILCLFLWTEPCCSLMSSELPSLLKNRGIKIVNLYSRTGDRTQGLRHVSVCHCSGTVFFLVAAVLFMLPVSPPLKYNMFDKLSNSNGSF